MYIFGEVNTNNKQIHVMLVSVELIFMYTACIVLFVNMFVSPSV